MDYLEFRQQTSKIPERDFSNLQVLMLEGVIIIPSDSPINGEVGFMAFREVNGIEVAANVGIKIHPLAVTHVVDTKEEFLGIFDDAISKDYPIEPCDDPVKRFAGFIVNKRSSRDLYYLSAHKLKAT